jgi:hypothetical protein
VAVAALAIAGCSSSNEPAPTTTSPTASSGTTTGTKAPGTTSTTAKTSGTTPGTAKTGGTMPKGTTVDTPNDQIEADDEAKDVTWTLNAADFRGQDGRRIAYDCTPDGTAATVWGSGTYTDDSSVCTAAVFEGLISLEDGGRVVIEISPGLDAYETATANGITTEAYPAWPGSYIFPGT